MKIIHDKIRLSDETRRRLLTGNIIVGYYGDGNLAREHEIVSIRFEDKNGGLILQIGNDKPVGRNFRAN